ncbi:hypothetical protein [Muricoccus radiodurans]|uniref:hypothetical protein n=1 Tax=Muricoccus radiodurans TaxID=2231721 RepID=UPI003CEFA54B
MMVEPQLTLRIVSMVVHTPPIEAEHMRILANLGVEYGPLLVVGAALAQSPDGTLRVWLPNFGRHRRVVLRDHAERARLLQLALEAYRALVGSDPALPPLAKASTNTDSFHEHA